VLGLWGGLEFECSFDDVGGGFECVDLLHLGLDLVRLRAVFVLFKDGLDCGAKARHVEFVRWDDDACAFCGNACGYSGLIVALWDGDEGDAFGEGFEDGVETGVSDDCGGLLEEFELWSVTDENWRAGECAETSWIEAAAERENELDVEGGTGFGDRFEGLFRAVLECAE